MTKGAAVSRTSAGAELSDALQAVGSATKDKAADTAKKVKARTVEASDSVASAFDTAARQSWRTRRKTDRRSRVRAAKRRRRAAQAERRAAAAIAPLTESVAQAERRAAAAIAPLTESVANLVSRDEELPKKKRKSVKTVAFTLLAAGATLAVIQQLLGRRHTDAMSTDSSGAEPGESVPEQATATASEVTNAATDQAATVTDIAAEKVSDLSDTVANTTDKAAAKATSPRKRTARSTTKSSGSTAAGEAPSGDAG
jgi:hypothetical protein